MKILITGATGMVGKNLKEYFLMNSSHELLTPSSKEMNLCSSESVESFFNAHEIDCVIHCAGRVGGIQANIKNPVNFLVENTQMGLNITLTAQKHKIKKLINLGSSCMYPKDYKNPLKESYILEDKLEPTNEGYALAKIAVAKLCEYINRENEGYFYKTLIPCNLYGYHDKFDPKVSHMIPAVIRKIHEAKEKGESQVEIWGDGTARREFMFTEDLAEFIALCVEKVETLPDYLNVGIGTDNSILEFYQTIAKVVGYSGDFTFDTSKPTGMMQKLVDVTELSKTGWIASHSLEAGITKTYEYFLKNEV